MFLFEEFGYRLLAGWAGFGSGRTPPPAKVLVNGVRIAFEDIENKGLEEILVPVPELDIKITIKVIDARRTDLTGR